MADSPGEICFRHFTGRYLRLKSKYDHAHVVDNHKPVSVYFGDIGKPQFAIRRPIGDAPAASAIRLRGSTHLYRVSGEKGLYGYDQNQAQCYVGPPGTPLGGKPCSAYLGAKGDNYRVGSVKLCSDWYIRGGYMSMDRRYELRGFGCLRNGNVVRLREGGGKVRKRWWVLVHPGGTEVVFRDVLPRGQFGPLEAKVEEVLAKHGHESKSVRIHRVKTWEECGDAW